MMRTPTAALCLAVACLGTSCDNVARLWDTARGTPTGQGSAVQIMATGGNALDQRPRVLEAFPDGNGWPASVPVVVAFSESVNRDSVSPPQGSTASPGLQVRASTTQTAIPASYDFLLGDQVVVIRPVTPLPSAGGTSYEVVVDPSLTDADGVPFGGKEPKVVATFTPDQDSSVEDGRIVTTLPRNHERDRPRETPIYVVFDRPLDQTSVSMTNVVVRPAGGSAIAGQVTFPLATATLTDSRVLRFDPDASALDGDTDYEIVVDDTLKFGNAGVLQFNNRTPFSDFTTLGFRAVSSVAVGNATAGFPNKVNRNNIDSLQIDVAVDASAAAGDDIIVRVYGLDPSTANNPDDVAFEERSTKLLSGGQQTVAVDFSGRLGTLAKPRFSDGRLTFAAQIARGSRRAGYVLSSNSNRPEQDLVVPDLMQAGPPAGSTSGDLVVDQEWAAFWGTATEELGAANLTAGSATADLFASDSDGGFLMKPIDLQLRTVPLAYQLSITDTAGNMAPTAFTGNLVPRGVVTGSVASTGSLTVEAYDEATLQPISGAVVVVDPGLPVKPAVGQMTAVTGTDGRVLFPGLSGSSYSVTIVASGYHLKSLLGTGASHVSLPVRPIANATATFSGTAAFLPSGGTRALIGSNLIDDPLEEEIATTTSAPTSIPATAIRPNRPNALSAFAGVFEPSGTPTFSFHACQMCGTTGLMATAPDAPAVPGASVSQTLTMMPIALTTMSLATPYNLDFASAGGLDTGNLIGTPTVRIVGSLRGFAGMTLFGVGFANLGSGTTYSVNGTYALSSALNLAPFGPVLYVSTEARDASGNVSRHRQLISTSTGATVTTVNPPGVPTLAAGGAQTGSPLVTFQDRQSVSTTGVFAFTEITAIDGNGRRWSVLFADTDGATGTDTVQLPDLSSAGVVGLATGTWSLYGENHVMLSLSFATDSYVLEELRRQQVAYSRSAAISQTVN